MWNKVASLTVPRGCVILSISGEAVKNLNCNTGPNVNQGVGPKQGTDFPLHWSSLILFFGMQKEKDAPLSRSNTAQLKIPQCSFCCLGTLCYDALMFSACRKLWAGSIPGRGLHVALYCAIGSPPSIWFFMYFYPFIDVQRAQHRGGNSLDLPLFQKLAT